MRPINVILPLLSGVKSNGSGKWTACCPAHEDKSPSLAIKELDDGQLLLHCFGGCSVVDVVRALGLSMEDLWPDKPTIRKPERQPFDAMTVLKCLYSEAGVVEVILGDMLAGREVTETGLARLRSAHEKIEDAIRLAGGTV